MNEIEAERPIMEQHSLHKGPGERGLRRVLRRHRKIDPLQSHHTLAGFILATLERVEEEIQTLTHVILARLLSQLNEHFNDDELRELCFELTIDYEELPGPAKSDRVRELVTYCLDHDRVDQLILAIRRERPHLYL